MKKALLCMLLSLLMASAFAQNVTTVDGRTCAVSITSPGVISISTDKNEILLYSEQKTKFINALKVHADFLNEAANQKFEVQAVRCTARYPVGIADKVYFWVSLNTVKDAKYVFEIVFDNQTGEQLLFDATRLNSLISALENVKDQTDKYQVELKKLEDMIDKIKKNI